MTADGAPPPPGPEPMFTTGPLRWRAAVPRHRRSGGSRVRVVLGGLVMLVAVVAAGGAVTDGRLSVDEQHREFVVTGELGQPVSARTVEVTVLEVRTAAMITGPSSGPHDTAGVWVLVRVRAMAHEEPATIGYAAVRDSGGRTWLAAGRVTQPLSGNGYQLQPGIPVEADVAFEVPRAAATDLTIRLAAPTIDIRMDAVAEVALPVDRRQVAEAVAGSEPVPVAEVEVVIADPQVLVGTGVTGR